MKYRVVRRGNPGNLAEPRKQYANSVNAGKFTIEDFAEEMAKRTSHRSVDIENTLFDFLEEIQIGLKEGLSVKLADFGTFRLNLVSSGVATDKEFTADDISGARILFTPSSALKESLKDISFEEE